MTDPAVPSDDELREALGFALEAVTAVFPGPPPLRILRGDLGWAVDVLLPVVSRYADQRAAEELRAAAEDVSWPTVNATFFRRVLRARAAALDGDQS